MKSDDELRAIILEMADIQANDVSDLPADYFKDDRRLTDKEYVRVVKLCEDISFTVTFWEEKNGD